MANHEDDIMSSRRILPLPADVAAQVQSSAAITSLPAVIIGLVKNSMDAGAQHVKIELNSLRGDCSVEDDGTGILEDDFRIQGGLGSPHCTSKYGNRKLLHGTHGLFLSSLVQLALVSITSRHSSASSVSGVTFHRGRRINAPDCEVMFANNKYGTKVVVRNLFSGLPVRLKNRIQLAPQLVSDEWDTAREEIVRLLLAWKEPVDLTMHDLARSKDLKIRMLRPGSADPLGKELMGTTDLQFRQSSLRILSQSGMVEPDSWPSWIPVSGSSAAFAISGCISLNPAPSKDIQFISFGIFPLSNTSGHSVIFEEINRIFAQSNFGVDDDPETLDTSRAARTSSQTRQARRSKKNVNRWPMFYFNISKKRAFPSSAETERQLMNGSAIKMEEIQTLMAAVTMRWLSENHFTARKAQQRRHTNVSTETTDSPSVPSFKTSLLETSDIRVSSNRPGRSIEKVMPFRSWSRIKSADPGFYDYLWARPCTSNGDGASSGLKGASNKTGTLEFQKGALQTPSPTPQPTSKTPDFEFEKNPDSNGGRSSSDTNKFTLWTDPQTKETYRIDLRTGIVRNGTSHTVPTRLSSPVRSRSVKSTVHVQGSLPISSLKNTSAPATPWIDSLLDSWQNPVFPATEKSISRAEPLAEHCNDAVRGSNSSGDMIYGGSINGIKLSIQGLRGAEVVSQVDNKFTLVKMAIADPNSSPNDSGNAAATLILVDQHAADERIQIESLFSELCSAIDQRSQEFPRATTSIAILPKPIVFEVGHSEALLLLDCAKLFARWGLHYDTNLSDPNHLSQHENRQAKVLVKTLPLGIAERCQQEPATLIELLRAEIWQGKRGDASNRSSHSNPAIGSDASGTPPAWIQAIGDCPRGIIDLLVSRSCRSAIMFNDPLSVEDCRQLVTRLADCAFPFQCAHGRPSMVPLVDLGITEATSDFGNPGPILKDVRDDETASFKSTYRKWLESRTIDGS